MTALGLAVLAAGGLSAAPAVDLAWRFGPSPGYAVRVTLPAARPDAPFVAEPSAREAPLEVIAAVPSEPAAISAPPIELAAAQSAPSAPPRALRAKVPGMIALSYSLAGGANAGDAIEVEKPVSVGGTEAGRIPLRIDGNAHVFALGSRLAAIIAAQSGEKAVPEGLEQDFVSLDRLRALGIGVRYDAINDRLVVDPPA